MQTLSAMLQRFVACVFGAACVAGCGSSIPSGAKQPTLAPAFKVNELLGLTIDQVQTALGTSGQDSVSAYNAAEHNRQFRRDTVLLQVGYDVGTHHVRSFQINTVHAQWKEYRGLLQLANLTGDEPSLIAVPLHSLTNPAVYTGVKLFVKDGSR